MTKFVIERHHHEVAGMLKNTVRPDSVIPTYRWTETLLRKPHSDDGTEYEPADVYAGLRHDPLVRKSWFSFAPSSVR